MDEVKPPTQGPDEFPIDMDLVKVLASDTRRDILRLLQKRRMTLSEMATALDLKKATVLEHLKKLTEAGLIRRLDDERLWVYYELTHRGGRLVNPGRTRFFLVLGAAAAAAVLLMGVAALALTLQDANGDDDAARAIGAGGLHAELSASEALAAGAPITLHASVRSDDGASPPVRALLLRDHERDALSRGVLQGIPLHATAAAPDAPWSADERSAAAPAPAVVELRSAQPVPAGDYFLYVSDAQGRDNAHDLTPVRVPAYTADAPDILWRGLDGAARVEARRDGAPFNGTLLLIGEDAASGRAVETLPLVDGAATLAPARLDALPPGEYALRALIGQSNDTIELAERLVVRDPLALVAPLDVAQSARARLTLTLSAGGDAVPPAPEVLVEGAAAPLVPVAPGVYAFDVNASTPGALSIHVGRLVAREVVVHPDVQLVLEPRGDGRLNVTTRAFDGAPLSNATLLLGGAAVAETNETGGAVIDAPPSGVHEMRVRSGAAEVARQVRFDGWNATEVAPRLEVRIDPPQATVETLRVNVRVANLSTTERPVAITAALDAALFAVARANATEYAFELASPPSGDHALVVQARVLQLSPLVFVNGSSAEHIVMAEPGSTDSSSPPPASPPPAPIADDSADAAPSSGRNGTAYYRYEGLALSSDDAVRVRVVVPTPVATPTVEFRHVSPTVADGGAVPEAAVPGAGAAAIAAAIALAALVAARGRRRGR